MKKNRRAIVIVLDSLGAGALPDAGEYGDEHANTLGHLCNRVPHLALPNLARLGLGNIGRFSTVPPQKNPAASFGKMAEASAGKDTTTGHWELMGLITKRPFPTYPHGFPPGIIDAFEKAIGRKTLGNLPASGTEIIQKLGAEHLRTGSPIVYTSADSVFQIAAHEAVIPLKELYDICKEARKILVPPHGVSRVIARPFTGTRGAYIRTDKRHDFSLFPPKKTVLNHLQEQGFETVGVGKINDIFASSGITHALPTSNNQEGVDRTLEALNDVQKGLILTNLVDFDMRYGHRNDPLGYAEALMVFDQRLPQLQKRLHPQDILVLTADHGCDPTVPGTDHTREYVPLLIQGEMVDPGVDLGIRKSLADLGKTLHEFFVLDGALNGASFWKKISSPDCT